MAARTSDTHPIYADWLDIAFPGRLGMTIAPGTKDQSNKGARWERDVDKDLDALMSSASNPMHVLVCLLEDHELTQYGITSLFSSARARGLELIRFPIPDTLVPRSREAVDETVQTILDRLRAGRNVVVHCRGGIGRTGTIVGCVLRDEGVDADTAFAWMKAARKEVMPETEPQREFVRSYARARRAPSNFDLLDILFQGSPMDLADARARVRASAVSGARALVASAEAAVASEPRGLALDETGHATLNVLRRSFAAGKFAVRSIADLRREVKPAGPGRVSVSVISGATEVTDIGSLQAYAAHGTLFQVASQLNCLEAPAPTLTKVAHYFSDHTQGPRASISAFPGTLLRHYAAPDADGARFVQSASKQLNLLAGALPTQLGRVDNGYLLTHNLSDPGAAAQGLEERFEQIAVGVHDGVQVVLGHDWFGAVEGAPRIAQVFTSSLAAGGYSRGGDRATFDALCRPLLRAAYLGTLLAAASLGKRRVLLTLIGGGAFKNPLDVIWDSIFWAADEAERAGAILTIVVNAHMTSVPKDIDSDCGKRGGRVVRLRGGHA